ncbi:hypothetical protein N7478_009466 [Penicillium angulare]|uniref:uncharacterized protein n=1 Tax=Penicillium angulare TaxID=116970 RepID=UPI002540483F|nr:uncharacterized protein N7478_009466 [Penicillium angulare]KAJ5266658.1 hypothetical protein N7478_009466 [Penicillium angulare]
MSSQNDSAKFTTTRYKLTIPPGVVICKTKPEIVRLQNLEANLGTLGYPENGGHYLKFPEGKVVAVASDHLCLVLDESYMVLYFNLKSQGLDEEAEQTLKSLRKAGIDADALVRDASDAIKGGACVYEPMFDGWSRHGPIYDQNDLNPIYRLFFQGRQVFYSIAL